MKRIDAISECGDCSKRRYEGNVLICSDTLEPIKESGNIPETCRLPKAEEQQPTYDIANETGCIGTALWKACKTCRNNDSTYGCVIKESIPLSLHLGAWILCGDYEKQEETK